MTTIAARRAEDGSVSLAWDAQVTSGNVSSKHFIKVRRVNEQFAVGVSGHLRFANLIHWAAVDRIHGAVLADDGFDPEEWVVNTLVPAWGMAVGDAKESGTVGEDGPPVGSVILVLRGTIFEVGEDFSVCDMGEFAAVGSGGLFALTAMHLGESARRAVEVASELDLYTGGEIRELVL